MAVTDHSNNHRPFIKFDKVTLKSSGILCFNDTSLVMEYGQNWAITGPTGSGKSLLVSAILHRTGLYRGQILYYFDDDETEGRPYLNKNEAFLISPLIHRDILQKYGGYHQARWQSFEGEGVPAVSEYLSGKSIEHASPFEVTPLSTNEAVYEDRSKKAIGTLQISHLLERKLTQLSNGEMRKVLMARALTQKPKLLILDDPYCGFDTASRKILHELINGILLSEFTKILLVLNDPDDIPENATHIMSVENKKIIMAGVKTISGRDEHKTVALDSGRQKDFYTEGKSSKNHGSREIIVEMRNVNITYGTRPILKNISWIMHRGENWALLGPNGSGKTTLLSLILADNPQAYSNEIYLFGRKRGSGESIWDIKRRIGWVSSELQYYYESSRSCLDVVCSGFFDSIGLYNDISGDQMKKALSWMDELQISHIADKDFYFASAGEQRLSLLARALVKGPELFILDEPCQGLDRKYGNTFNGLVEKLCGQGIISAIYVTHNRGEIPGCFNNVLELRAGEIVRQR